MNAELQAGELQRLAATFLRGTARTELPALPGGPLGEALAHVQRSTPEETLLARAALSGLYAQAGRIPARVQTPVPVFVTTYADERPEVPEALLALLPALTQRPALLHQTLSLTAAAGLKLTAPQALPLLALTDGGSDAVSGPLWTLLDEHGRWLARLNPDWKRHDPATPPDALRLIRLRRELVEAHAADPEATVAELLSRWPTFRADERREVLGAIAGGLCVADLPLLELAQADRLEDLRSLARLLMARLPGEVADQTRAALRASVRLDKKGKLQFLAAELPAGLLGPTSMKPSVQPRAFGVEDDLALLITATPIEELVALLGNIDARTVPLVLADDRLGRALNLSAAGGADLSTLVRLRQPHSFLLAWPQARRRERFWEAVGELLSQNTPARELMAVARELLEGLEHPFAMPEENTAAPARKPGLLGRLRQLVQPRSAPADEMSRLHSLFARVLKDVATSLPLYQGAHLELLSRLVLHLDPLTSLPDLPAAPPLSGLAAAPSREDLNRQAGEAHRREYLEQQYAEFVQVFELRRRVQRLLPSNA